MRARLLVTLSAVAAAAAAAHAAAPGELETGAGWEVSHPPPSRVPVRGPRFAPVTIDVWIAFSQQGASSASQNVAQLARRLTTLPQNGDVREVVHLTEQGPPGADLAVEAALEAAAEGRCFEFLDRALGDRTLALTAADLERAGREAGLDGARLAEALATRQHRAAAVELDREARSQGHSAGEMLVNGLRVPYASEELLNVQLGEARRRAQQLLDDGVPLSRLYEKLLELAADAQVPDPSPNQRVAVSLAGSPSRGPSLAPITVVVYANLVCPGCSAAAQLVRRLNEAFPGRVREVWKHYVPPYATYQQYGEPYAAELAAAAAAQGRFWELHDRVFAPGAPRAKMERSELDRLLREVGGDPARARPDLLRPVVERDVIEARKLGVLHAPALLVNGLLYPVLPSFERLSTRVRTELGRGLLDRLQSP